MAFAAENLELSLTDSMARRLRLSFAALTGEQRLKLDQLMEASSLKLDKLARTAEGLESRIANGVLSCPREFLRWEAEHARAMRRVAFAPRRLLQLRTLLQCAMQMTHRAALFEFLRTHQLRGTARRRLVAHFHGQLNYTQSLVTEHGNFLRGSASLFCARHLATRLFHDSKAADAIEAYADVYNEYFASYCDTSTQLQSEESESALLPELKQSVRAARHTLLTWGQPGPNS